MATQRWIPLESNPTVLNKYIENLGVSGKHQFVDIYGFEPDLLAMVPRPVLAVVLLYPLTEKTKSKDIGNVGPKETSLYFMRQTISNACGTVALVHALANNENKMEFSGDKYFKEFLDKTKGMSAEEKAEFLEKDENMGAAHEESAQEGDTQAPSRDTTVNPHFVAFVCKDGHLYEMDGRKEAPICHGETSEQAFLENTVNVVKEFMARDPDELNFNLMALAEVDG